MANTTTAEIKSHTLESVQRETGGAPAISVAEVRFSSGPTPLALNVNTNALGLGERERERELNGRSRSTAFSSRSVPIYISNSL